MSSFHTDDLVTIAIVVGAIALTLVLVTAVLMWWERTVLKNAPRRSTNLLNDK